MRELFARRYDAAQYRLECGKCVVRTFTPKLRYGTVLVGIAFSSYLYPVVAEHKHHATSFKDKSHVRYTTH
jgi:hypothetical protein